MNWDFQFKFSMSSGVCVFTLFDPLFFFINPSFILYVKNREKNICEFIFGQYVKWVWCMKDMFIMRLCIRSVSKYSEAITRKCQFDTY